VAEFLYTERHDARFREWLVSHWAELTDALQILTPTQFSEHNRYLPKSVSRFPGYINFDLTPYWREILDCFSPEVPVREVAVMKGVQVAYTTALETLIFYLAGHLRTSPGMYATADKGLSKARIENNIIPMFQQSGMADIFQSSDVTNSRKQGVTREQLQWKGGGYLVPYGALNADKMRQFSIFMMLMDELDAWKPLVKNIDPVRAFKDRCGGYWLIRKIFMGSTPEYKGASHIEKQFLRGDQRRYFVNCLACGYPQYLRWKREDREADKVSGFKWEYREDGTLDPASVRYECSNCNHGHVENDKTRLFCNDNAEWKATAIAKEDGCRSYHIPAMYSPVGMQPWSKCVIAYLEAMDPETGRCKDLGALMIYYNNVLGEPFEALGSKVSFSDVSSHRRTEYHKGEIPNKYIREHCESGILMLVCTVDVHKSNLAVSILGFTRGMSCWLVDYFRLYDDSDTGCADPGSPTWGALREVIEDTEWVSDDGITYPLAISLVDSGWATSVVLDFCAEYESGVYPIVGRERTSRSDSTKEHAPYQTQAGTRGYRILVDHYKGRLAPVLRRQWRPELGTQKPYTFNAPVDTLDSELKELTVERLRKKVSPNGVESQYWYRPQGAPNELWDLLVYGHAAVEILAWNLSVEHYGEDTVDWGRFWDLVETQRLFMG
jgi:phage terminase large subunit GpA-like protein